nr:xylulose kinase-1 [Tanacetum cinerariifolium]
MGESLITNATSLTKQERKCKLYDAFDKFTYIKEESLHKYYLRFTHLINDMNIYNVKMKQFQVNTKFLNSVPPEWRDDPIACLSKAMDFLIAVLPQIEDLDTYDSDCDDVSNAKVVLVANISNYGSDVISKETLVPQQELSADEAFWYHMLNPSTKSSDALPVKIEAPKELPKVILGYPGINVVGLSLTAAGSRLMQLSKADTAAEETEGITLISVSHMVSLDLSKLAIILNWLKKIHSKGLTSDTNGMIKVLPPKTAKEVVAREMKRKARTILLMSLPEDHLAKFHKKADAKEMWEAIKSRFGSNDESKKMQNYLLKQQFEVFYVCASEVYIKALIMRIKRGLDTLSFDDLHNNLRVFERDVKGTTASLASNTSLIVIKDDDMEEMDLKWQMAMISMRIKKFYKRTRRKLAKGNQDSRRRDVGYNGNKAKDNDTQNYAMMAYSSNNSGSDNEKLLAKVLKEKEDLKTKFENWQNSFKNLSKLLNTHMSANDKFGHGYGDYRYGSILSYENEVLQSVFMNTECDLEDTPVNDRYAEGMHAVPPPMIGNYMPSRPDVEIDYSKFTYGPKQTSVDESDAKPCENASCGSDSSVETSTSMPEPVDNAPKIVCKPKVWTDAPIIEEYESDSDDDSVSNV